MLSFQFVDHLTIHHDVRVPVWYCDKDDLEGPSNLYSALIDPSSDLEYILGYVKLNMGKNFLEILTQGSDSSHVGCYGGELGMITLKRALKGVGIIDYDPKAKGSIQLSETSGLEQDQLAGHIRR